MIGVKQAILVTLMLAVNVRSLLSCLVIVIMSDCRASLLLLFYRNIWYIHTLICYVGLTQDQGVAHS